MISGGCHCGKIEISFETLLTPAEFNPRACDCSFCTKHGAMYISDATGHLLVNVKDPSALGKYRQGAELADFLYCRGCGILVAVVCESESRSIGAVNARCLKQFAEFGASLVASPQKLSPDEKKARWLAIWMPVVIAGVPGIQPCADRPPVH